MLNLYIYIDVSPRDLEWTALVKSLLDQPNIKILVTIREEDLARQNVSNIELGFPEGIPLHFSKSEAKIIYQNLVDKKFDSSSKAVRYTTGLISEPTCLSAFNARLKPL